MIIVSLVIVMVMVVQTRAIQMVRIHNFPLVSIASEVPQLLWRLFAHWMSMYTASTTPTLSPRRQSPIEVTLSDPCAA